MVAVKVQRPGVKAAIALDIYILRFVVGIIKKAGKFNTDLQVMLLFSVDDNDRINSFFCKRYMGRLGKSYLKTIT